ncbi:MAG: amidohydrolase family protein [Lysobacterales bacterium]|jgi:predicted TIM-barrel fold metal-dependent hydrolase
MYRLGVLLLGLFPAVSTAGEPPPPIIDMHLHAIPIDFEGPPPRTICAPFSSFPAWDPKSDYREVFSSMGKLPGCGNPVVSPMTAGEVMRQTLAVLEEFNIYGVTSGPMEMVEKWRQAAPDRIIPGLLFQLTDGTPSPETIRRWHREGKLSVLGEVTIQYQGIEPDDPRFEPWLAMAEEIDLPVGIHIGTGPPGAPYLGFKNYRARMHSPLSLEEPLVRHPKLRVYVMHAGWPMLDDTLALLYAHPQVYVGLGVIDYVLPRAEFHRYLRRLVEAGFGSRILFGSDQMIWPETIRTAIGSIESADFLSEQQKRDIFYNNAARFLRLSDTEAIAQHGKTPD